MCTSLSIKAKAVAVVSAKQKFSGSSHECLKSTQSALYNAGGGDQMKSRLLNDRRDASDSGEWYIRARSILSWEFEKGMHGVTSVGALNPIMAARPGLG